MSVLKHQLLYRKPCHKAGAALLFCSWALSAQTQPGLLPSTTTTELDFPLATPVAAVEGKPAPLDLAGKTDYFIKSAFSPMTLSRMALSTGLTQFNASEEWGDGASGFGRRLRSNYFRHLTASTVRFGIGALRGEDPRFYRSGKEGFWARTGFVLSRTVIVRMDDGSNSVAVGKLAGAFAGQTVAAHGRLTPAHPWQTSLTNTAGSLGTDIGFRMLREFWPDIKRKFRK